MYIVTEHERRGLKFKTEQRNKIVQCVAVQYLLIMLALCTKNSKTTQKLPKITEHSSFDTASMIANSPPIQYQSYSVQGSFEAVS